MRRRSLIRLAVVPVLGLAVLAGCGSVEEGSSSGGSSGSSSPSSEDSGGEGVEAAAPLTRADFGDYSGFGDPVDIQAPPASQTITKAPGLGG